VRALAYPLAVLLLAGIGVGAVALVVGSTTWARWVLRTGGVGGALGLLLVVAAAGNLFVSRTCAEAETAVGTITEVNRPAFSVVVDDGSCFRSGLAQVQLLVLAVVVTSGVSLVAAGERRPAT
jgi:hypothetical protein